MFDTLTAVIFYSKIKFKIYDTYFIAILSILIILIFFSYEIFSMLNLFCILLLILFVLIFIYLFLMCGSSEAMVNKTDFPSWLL